MKAYVAIQPDFEHEVQDVVLIIEDQNFKRTCWISGFDDVEWEAANAFAEKVAKTLSVEFVGEIEEYIDELESEQ